MFQQSLRIPATEGLSKNFGRACDDESLDRSDDNCGKSTFVEIYFNALRWMGVEQILDHLLVEIGIEILKIIPGRVSTEVDGQQNASTRRFIQCQGHSSAVRDHKNCGNVGGRPGSKNL
jgi:hypothetical protein